MRGDLAGKVAIVTGGVRGIGRAIAIAFAQEGAEVAVFDLDAEDSSLVRALLEEIIAASGEKCLYKKVNITHMQEVSQAVEETIKVFGKVDILVNNAGGGRNPTPLEELEERDWDQMMDLNLKGTYFCTKAVIKNMKEQSGGKIINISSQAGRSRSEFSNLPYASAKAGVLGFTRQLAYEVGPLGINVNAIAPGVTMGGERIAKRWEKRTEEERRKMLEDIPLRRLGKPMEIARVAVFLASENSSYITGAVIDVNGGRFMM